MFKNSYLLVAGSLLIGFSHASAGEMPAPPSFAELDANGDQYVDAEELQSFREQMRARRSGERKGGREGCKRGGGRFNPIDRADSDGDGMLNEQEYLQFTEEMQERRERMLERRRQLEDGEA